MKKLLIALALIQSFSANAKDCEKGADSLGQIRACMLEESEKPIKSALNKLLVSLGDNQEAIEWLNKSQLSWLKYRDNSCIFSGKTSDGFVGENDIILNCQIEFNKARVKVLNGYIKSVKQ